MQDRGEEVVCDLLTVVVAARVKGEWDQLLAWIFSKAVFDSERSIEFTIYNFPF